MSARLKRLIRFYYYTHIFLKNTAVIEQFIAIFIAGTDPEDTY